MVQQQWVRGEFFEYFRITQCFVGCVKAINSGAGKTHSFFDRASRRDTDPDMFWLLIVGIHIPFRFELLALEFFFGGTNGLPIITGSESAAVRQGHFSECPVLWRRHSLGPVDA